MKLLIQNQTTLDPYPSINNIINNSLNYTEIIAIAVPLLILLYFSSILSAAEVAYFSLSNLDLKELEASNTPKDRKVKKLLNSPQKLLASILITNNLVNVSVIILSYYCISLIFNISAKPIIGISIQILVISFVLLLCGEIMPKLNAKQNPLRTSRNYAKLLNTINTALSPISKVILKSTNIFSKQIEKHKQTQISMNDISQAIEDNIPTKTNNKSILLGIANFGNTTADKIMSTRADIISIAIEDSYSDVIKCIVETEYSRIPVYSKTLDDIKGVLYAKDLIPHLNKDNFKWQSLLRKPYFVPETIKIDDLLQHFQKDRTHIAIVVDEFGGTSGIVTLEDILEEVVGDISDEYDTEERLFSKTSNNTFIFEAKISLVDFCRAIDSEDCLTYNNTSDIDTLAGLLLDIKGEIPNIGTTITLENLLFEVIEADNRRIIKVKLTINE